MASEAQLPRSSARILALIQFENMALNPPKERWGEFGDEMKDYKNSLTTDLAELAAEMLSVWGIRQPLGRK